MKKFLLSILIISAFVGTFFCNATDTNIDWYADVNVGTHIVNSEYLPYLCIEGMGEYKFFMFGGEANITIKDWAMQEFSAYGKIAAYGQFANIYGEAGLGVGFSWDLEEVVMKYKPEVKLKIDMGDYASVVKIGLTISSWEISKEDVYMSVGVQKRF